MSTINQVTATFAHLLADNLSTPVHVLRNDPNDPSADKLQMNAVNLQFLDFDLGNGSRTSAAQVVIDVVADDSNTCLDVVQDVANILRAAFFYRVYDYSDPAHPAATNSNIFWDDRFRFKCISADTAYAHYACVLPVRFRSI